MANTILNSVFNFRGRTYVADLLSPIDISIPLVEGEKNVNAFGAPHMKTEPVVNGDFIGDVKKGGPLNFKNVYFNPHGNGTHTECVGHIVSKKLTVNKCLDKFHFVCRLKTVTPEVNEAGDSIITFEMLKTLLDGPTYEAMVIRTLPNKPDKLNRKYTGTNPPYFDKEAIIRIREAGVKHLLVDMPSVDKEQDGGAMICHKAFWNVPKDLRTDCTITEMIYVDNAIKDGLYLLNIQIASFELDVSPSKPVLYRVKA